MVELTNFFYHAATTNPSETLNLLLGEGLLFHADPLYEEIRTLAPRMFLGISIVLIHAGWPSKLAQYCCEYGSVDATQRISSALHVMLDWTKQSDSNM
jgi:hypothetical protein